MESDLARNLLDKPRPLAIEYTFGDFRSLNLGATPTKEDQPNAMTDLDIIRQIENELDVKLEELDEIGWHDIGYNINQNGQVTDLGLTDCKIASPNRIISPLKSLKNLTKLILTYNELSDISSLRELRKLTELNLSDNKLSDISPLKGLKNLMHLNLRSNQLKDISPLKGLKNLTHLNLRSNQLSDISPLKELANLTQLDLSSNDLSDFSLLKALPNLTQLDISLNRLSDIASLKELQHLTHLDLSYNYLRDFSPLKELPNLTQLDISSNNLSDISSLRGLKNLAVLYLDNNNFSDISPLKELPNLIWLGLHNNLLTDISPLKGLKNLTTLDLSDNRLTDISPLKGLENLTRLDLWDNHLSDINSLKELKNLTELNLWDNSLEELPPWITEFDMEIRWKATSREGYINFAGNPLKSPPPEVIQQGKEAIRNYFEQLKAQEEDYLFEAKMLIIGEPGAGKTSLAWKLADADCALPQEEETTRGIEVSQYYFPLQTEDFSAFPHPEKLEKRQFRLNLWDFGGQEIYQATHRFFLSKRSLYALVADSRNEDTDFNYWLHIVEMFGGDSPLLIVLNEKHQRQRHLDISAMQNRFTNISEVLKVDFAEADKTRLNKLERAVKYYVSQLPHIGSPVPAKWTVVREALENDPRHTITLQDYLAICAEHGITKRQDALVLSQYFHDIGVFLHFQDDDLLRRTIFLKPNWATNAVYKILDHDLLNQKQGRFNRADANIIWREDEYDLVRAELLRLMQKFFLTYQIDGSGEYIVPERLPPSQPDYAWAEKDNLYLRYEYDFFMPKGLMSQLTVLLHRYISNHQLVWRRGVVLERENTLAEIVESYDARRFKIRISGQNRRDFMTLITEQLDQINAQYEKMKVDKLIPCNCAECKADGKPHFFEYKVLKRRLEKGRREIECEKSFEFVNVWGLIDEVIEEMPSEGRIIAERKGRRHEKGEFHFRNIRTLLTKGLSDEELRQLCFDNPKFRPAYDKLSSGMGKDRMIQILLDYAERQDLIRTLLAEAEKLNPAQYDKHQPYYDDPIEFPAS